MSRTDKTDPHRVKVARYGERYWMPIYRCGRSCKHCWGWLAKAEDRRARRAGRRAERDWERDY